MTSVSIPGGVDRLSTVRGTVRNSNVLSLMAAVLLTVTVSGLIAGQLSTGTRGAEYVFSVFAVGGYIPAAMTAIEEEREQLRQERDAFDQFVTEVESITVPSGGTNATSPVLVGKVNSSGSELTDVQTAYCNTVMEVAHFEDEYGETLSENMRIELTDNVATAIMDGYHFSQPLKQAVIQQSIRARSRRESLLHTIDTERDSLEQTRDEVREIESAIEAEPPLSNQSLTDLFDYERRLRRYLIRYERLLSERQQYLHSNSSLRSEPDEPFFQTYLYDSLDVDFPVLATATERCEHLRKRQRTVQREITYR